MLSDTSVAFLKRLLDTPGPSGFEAAPARVWAAEAGAFSTVTRDVMGNTMAAAGPEEGPVVMLAGHIDEIGFIITYIDDDGFASIAPIGGWDPQVVPGQRLRILTDEGDVFGVVGKKPVHLMKPPEREKVTPLTDVFVDVGAASRAEAESMIAVGDAAVIDARTIELPNGRIVSRSIDDRVGAFVVLEALRRYAARPGSAHLVAVATVQEEIGMHGGGALVAAGRVNPTMAVAVDVTFATDHPQIEKREVGDHRLGGGPVLTRGSIISPAVFRLLRQTATSLAIPFSVNAAGRDTSTDADFLHIARGGVPTGLVSVPNRYMHSPNEMVSLSDLDHCAELLAELARRVDHSMDWTDRR